ncbi:MAG: peptide/nickel transport system permease protein [Solirubrobacteraceae bacterium]|jgi:peptide/nickel transport system permease protein|nr:peptide/nickel transport system permease protein [Solirubrobacteraceae bacterium]
MHDLDRALLHLDFGESVALPGSPKIRDVWREGIDADLWLLGGGLLLGIAGGVSAGVWCATRPRSLVARVLEAGAMVVYCTPVYVVGLGLLLVFNSTFGILPVPAFFDTDTYAGLLDRPWDWFRSLLFPWLVVAAPLGAACLRLTTSMVIEELEQDYVRTGVAKGLSPRTVVRRHAAPGAYPTLASAAWTFIPLVVTNVVLVETVFSVPGFFAKSKLAVSSADIPMLQALSLWAGLLIVSLSVVVDVALHVLDPRIRRGAPPGA